MPFKEIKRPFIECLNFEYTYSKFNIENKYHFNSF